MLPLWILAAHLMGDFVLQTRWQAEGKLGRTRKATLLRLRHVTVYCLPFVPIAVWQRQSWYAVLFLVTVFVLHFATDSRRFHSTLGESIWFAVKRGKGMPAGSHTTWREAIPIVRTRPLNEVNWLGGPDYREVRVNKLRPNPWTPTPIMVDQSLHMLQLAIACIWITT